LIIRLLSQESRLPKGSTFTPVMDSNLTKERSMPRSVSTLDPADEAEAGQVDWEQVRDCLPAELRAFLDEARAIREDR
jgi:hypothetical protein